MPSSIDGIGDIFRTWLVGGSSGVALFLVLSGFLFCIISDAGRKEIQYGQFLKNRILRIAPLVVFVVAIVISVGRQDSTPIDILRVLTMQLNTGHSYTGWGHNVFPFGPIWTIAVEFQFYLIFPFLAAFMGKYGWRYVVGLIVLMILTKAMIVGVKGPGIYWNLYHTIIGRLDQFLIGMIGGIVYISLGKRRTNYAVALPLATLALVGLTALMFYSNTKTSSVSIFGFTIEAALWLVVLYCYLTCNIKQPKFIDSSLSSLGLLSFSMYLLHIPIGNAMYKTMAFSPSSGENAVLMAACLILPVTLLASTMTYLTIEKPFLSLRKRYN